MPPTGPHAGSTDLSHVVTDGMTTYPGLPVPIVADHLTREAAEQIYGPGITFQIGLVTMCTSTGTSIDVPFHRFTDGHDLTELKLARVADTPAVCLDRQGQRTIDLSDDELQGRKEMMSNKAMEVLEHDQAGASMVAATKRGTSRPTTKAPADSVYCQTRPQTCLA